MIDDNVQELTIEAFLYAQNLVDAQTGNLEPLQCGVIGFHNSGGL
jgi:hypothetical protein